MTEYVAASAAIVREDSMLYISKETVIKNSKIRETRDELPAADIFERGGSHPASLAFAIFEAANVSDMKNYGSQPKPSSSEGGRANEVSEEFQANRPRDHDDTIVEKTVGG